TFQYYGDYAHGYTPSTDPFQTRITRAIFRAGRAQTEAILDPKNIILNIWFGALSWGIRSAFLSLMDPVILPTTTLIHSCVTPCQGGTWKNFQRFTSESPAPSMSLFSPATDPIPMVMRRYRSREGGNNGYLHVVMGNDAPIVTYFGDDLSTTSMFRVQAPLGTEIVDLHKRGLPRITPSGVTRGTNRPGVYQDLCIGDKVHMLSFLAKKMHRSGYLPNEVVEIPLPEEFFNRIMDSSKWQPADAKSIKGLVKRVDPRSKGLPLQLPGDMAKELDVLIQDGVVRPRFIDIFDFTRQEAK
ncbi:MAG: hypothetical protein KDD70_17225, partial [Bdellovibrionales bacterium]|nr:hypothetical protein [Bdellovibrionales bacterium]